MKCEWKHILLNEIMDFKNGKKRPTGDGNIPVYGGNGILSYTNESNCENCVIIGRVGAYCGSVFYEGKSCWVSDNAIFAKVKYGNDIRFAYYLLKYLELNKRHIGTGQPLLTQEILNRIEYNLPTLSQQKIISHILSSIDDKIKLNQKINDNLAF